MQDGKCMRSKGGELSDLLSLCCRCPQRYVLPTLPSASVQLWGVLVAVAQLLVLSNSLQPYKLQHIRLLCPSLSPRGCPNSCPLSWWYHPAISCSVAPFSSCLEFLIWTWPSMLFQWYIYDLYVGRENTFDLSLLAEILTLVFRHMACIPWLVTLIPGPGDVKNGSAWLQS